MWRAQKNRARRAALVTVIAAGLGHGLRAHACVKDMECKGARICVDGRCQDPGARPANPLPMNRLTHRYQTPASQSQWFSGYGTVSGEMTFHGWGIQKRDHPEYYTKNDISGKVAGGVHVAGLANLADVFHLGGFVGFTTGEVTVESHGTGSVEMLAAGLATKLGGRVGQHVWLGLALDVGATFWFAESDDTMYGLALHPAFELDLLLYGVGGGFKTGIRMAFGALIVPYAAGEFDGRDTSNWLVAPGLQIGMILGA